MRDDGRALVEGGADAAEVIEVVMRIHHIFDRLVRIHACARRRTPRMSRVDSAALPPARCSRGTRPTRCDASRRSDSNARCELRRRDGRRGRPAFCTFAGTVKRLAALVRLDVRHVEAERIVPAVVVGGLGLVVPVGVMVEIARELDPADRPSTGCIRLRSSGRRGPDWEYASGSAREGSRR